MFRFEEIKFKNPGVLLADVPKDVFDILSKSIDGHVAQKDVLKKFKTQHLGVGGIHEAIKFSMPAEFATFCEEYTKAYYEYFNLGKVKEVQLTPAWINLQKKTEYRPAHSHDGNISYVFWYKIPYKRIDEDAHDNNTPYKLDEMPNGRFQLIVSNYSGLRVSKLLDVDNEWEGKMLMFDSQIIHGVFPFFTSDELRISLAGNIYVVT